MEALSCHLMWVAAATYCSILAPKNLLATLIGVLGMAHFSLGNFFFSFVKNLWEKIIIFNESSFEFFKRKR